jgi:hypothetical protein
MTDLEKLLRFHILDRRNSGEEAVAELRLAAADRIAELEKQLLARGGHNSDCPWSWKGECYCGWEEMKKSLMVK